MKVMKWKKVKPQHVKCGDFIKWTQSCECCGSQLQGSNIVQVIGLEFENIDKRNSKVSGTFTVVHPGQGVRSSEEWDIYEDVQYFVRKP
jgi:hypothetical protein